MRVTVLLADSASAVEGKLYILGGGWTHIPLGIPMALAIKVDVPWDQANRQHQLRIELVDTDGQPLPIAKDQPLIIEVPWEIGRPPGLAPGSPLPSVFAFNFGPLPLQPNTRYLWRITINGHGNDDWVVPFSTLQN